MIYEAIESANIVSDKTLPSIYNIKSSRQEANNSNIEENRNK